MFGRSRLGNSLLQYGMCRGLALQRYESYSAYRCLLLADFILSEGALLFTGRTKGFLRCGSKWDVEDTYLSEFLLVRDGLVNS